MKNKLIVKIVAAYFVLLMIVLITQLPKREQVVTEPIVSELKYENKLKNAIVLYIDSPIALVNEKQILIDEEDSSITPTIVNNQTYVPIRFIAKVFNANLSWSKQLRETTIRFNNKAIIFGEKSDEIRIVDSISEKVKIINSPPEIINDNTYVPIRVITEVFEKELFYDNGLIIISNTVNIFDSSSDKKKIEELSNKLNGLPIVGSEDKLRELIGDEKDFFSNSKNWFSKNKKDNFYEKPIKNDDILTDSSFEVKNSLNLNNKLKSLNFNSNNESEHYKIKTDGKNIYYAVDEKIYIIDTENSSIVKTIIIENNFNIERIYVDNDFLIVFGNEPKYMQDYTDGEKQISGSHCNMYIYNIKDIKNVNLLRTVSLDGYFNNYYRSGEYIYIISDVSVYELEINNQYMPPSYFDSNNSYNRSYIDYKDIYYFPDMSENSFKVIAAVNLYNNDNETKVYSYLGSSNNIYISNNGLYISTENIKKEEKINKSKHDLNGNEKTNIYKFIIDNENINYAKRVNLKGQIHDYYSINSYNGFLRVSFMHFNKRDDNLYNSLYIFDDNLNIVGKYENALKQQKIDSSRFIENRAYMSLLERKDVLFVFDISNPKKPKYLGVLNIKGNNERFYSYNENTIIVFSTNQAEYEGNSYDTGLKIRFLDITDIKNPIAIYDEDIGNKGTVSEIVNNYKVFDISDDNNIIAFPITVFEAVDKENPFGDVKLSFQGVYMYSIDEENGIQLYNKITNFSKEEYENNEINNSEFIKNILIDSNFIYTFSNNLITLADLYNLDELEYIELN